MALINLTQGKHSVVDDSDLAELEKYKWWAVKLGTSYYAATKINKQRVLMHRLLMGLEIGEKMMVDHIDGDGLNNTRANMRLADATMNMRNRKLNSNNTSGIHGLYFKAKHGSAGAWRAVAMRDGKFVSKTFGCLKRGYEQAKGLADAWRKSHEAEYGITTR